MLVPHFHTRRFLQTQRLPFHPRNRSLHLFSFLFCCQIFHVAFNQQRYQIFALNTLLSDTKPCFHIIKCSTSLLYRLFDLSGRRAGTFTYYIITVHSALFSPLSLPLVLQILLSSHFSFLCHCLLPVQTRILRHCHNFSRQISDAWSP